MNERTSTVTPSPAASAPVILKLPGSSVPVIHPPVTPKAHDYDL